MSLRRIQIDITCPGCQGVFKKPMAEIIPGNSCTCPYCQAAIRYTGDDGSKLQRALDNLDRTSKKLCK